jgi:hypothetical protein
MNLKLIAAVLIIGLASCKDKTAMDTGTGKISPDVVNNPATADPAKANEEKNMPVFSFESDNHEFGEIVQGEKVSYSFKFKNTGNAPLVISTATASCGCTVPEYSKTPVQPGEEGFINVTFDSGGKSGMVSKTVTVIANTTPNTKVLTISADIQVPKEKS